MIVLSYGCSIFLTIGASGDTKRLDIDAVGTVNSVSIYEYDMDLGTDEKPWRDPGIYRQLIKHGKIYCNAILDLSDMIKFIYIMPTLRYL